jgi:queuine/archaeosine tRNA-ribosyltransferase
MDTAQWGPDGWKLLHSIACYYDNDNDNDKNIKNIKPFLRSIGHLLPCIYCRRSYKKYISELPPRNENVMKWMYDIHNIEFR